MRAAAIRGLACILALGLSSGAALPAPPATPAHDLKAVFLFNFARFVEWPADAFADRATPFTIGILGDDLVGASLENIVDGESVHGRKLIARRYASIDKVEPCHILFVGASQSKHLDRVLGKLEKRSVLTVGDGRDFTARRGVIAFETLDQRLKLRINVAAASDARLTISSKLLRQATIVGRQVHR